MASIGITRARRRAVRRLALAQVAAFAVSGIAFTTGPLSVLDLSGSTGLAGLVLALLSLSGGAGAWAGGRLIDRFGPARPLTGAHALAGAAGVGAAAGALLGSPALVLAACVPLGAGQGAALLGRVAVAAMHPPEGRGRATGRLVTAGAAGVVAGPGVGLPAGLLAGTLGLDARAVTWAVIPLLAATGALAVHGAGLGAHLAAPAADAPRARRTPSVPPRLAAVALACAQTTMAGVMAVAPARVHQHAGASAMTAVVAMHLAAMYGPAPVLGRLADRHGHRAVLCAGAGLCTTAAALVTVAHVPLAAALALLAAGVGWSASYLTCTAVLGARGDRPAGAVGGADMGAAAAGAGTALLGGASLGIVAPPVMALAFALPGLLVLALAGGARLAPRPARRTAPPVALPVN